MKKLFSLFLALTLTSSLCACGTKNEKKSTSNDSTSVKQAVDKKTDKPHSGDIRNRIDFSPEKVLHEDENVKIVLLSFMEEYLLLNDNPRFLATISYKVYNKTPIELTVSLSEGYMGDERAILMTGSATSLLGGKSNYRTIRVDKEVPTGEPAQSYSSKDLYNLNGIIHIYDANGGMNPKINYKLNYDFSYLKQ